MPGIINIGSWNIHGITSRLLGNKLKQPDVLDIIKKHDFFSIVETHAHINSELVIPDYKCLKSRFRPQSKTKYHGGISVFVKDSLKDLISYVPRNNENILWCKLKKCYFHNDKDIFLGTVYFSPEKMEKQSNTNYIDELDEDLLYFSQRGDVILQGDFNARTGHLQETIDNVRNMDSFLSLPDTLSEEPRVTRRNSCDGHVDNRGKQLTDSCLANDLLIVNGRIIGDSLGHKTCFQNNGSSLVDYIITTNTLFSKLQFMRVGNLLPHISDHAHITYSIALKSHTPSKNQSINHGHLLNYKLCWRESTPGKITKCLNSPELAAKIQNIEENSKDMHPEKILSEFEDMAFQILNDAGAVKTIKTTTKNTAKNEWFDNECEMAKENLLNLGRLRTRLPDNANIRLGLNASRRMFRKLLRRKKYKYQNRKYDDLCKLKSENPKDFWRAAKKLKITKDTKNQPAVDIQTFYDYFKKLNESSKNDTIANNDLTHRCNNDNTNETGILDFQFTEDEIKNGIKTLKNGKSPGKDLISNEFLKLAQESLVGIIAAIFNSVLTTGIFPKSWASGYIIPIHKKGSKTDPENYRGITILSHLGKLFTSLCNNRLVKYLEDNNILPREQAGFRKNYRGSDNLLIVKALIDKYVRNKPKRKENFLFTCFVDFSKAFDNISRAKLFQKLSDIGIKGKFLQIIRDMYSKDSASIKLNQYISEEFNCHKGVKQGCMLSPTLFNIYLNDLPDILSNDTSAPLLNGTQISCLLYADDLVIFSTTKSGLQENINRLLKFGKVNNLQVNESKTKILIFNPNGRKLNRYAFTNENKQLELTTEYKYLGLMLNASGTFTKTKQEIKKVALKAFYFLRKSMGPFFHKDVLLSVHLFNTLIMPILTYCGDVWGLDGSYNEMRDPIEQVHSKFCKQILGVSKRATNIACRAELGRLPILIDIKTQVIKYWFRLQTLDENRLLKQAYLDMIETRPSKKIHGPCKSNPFFSKSDLDIYGTVKTCSKITQTNLR